jgi:hypothetical protein
MYLDFMVSVSKMKKIKLEHEGLVFQEEGKDMYFNACCEMQVFASPPVSWRQLQKISSVQPL